VPVIVQLSVIYKVGFRYVSIWLWDIDTSKERKA